MAPPLAGGYPLTLGTFQYACFKSGELKRKGNVKHQGISVKLATMALLHISYWVENGKVYQKREISVQLKIDVFSTIYSKLFTHRPPLGWGGTRDKAPSCASSVTGRRLFTPFLPGSLPHTQPASGSLEALVGGQEQEPGPAPPEL